MEIHTVRGWMMDLKQLIYGANYTKIRAPRAQKSYRYVQQIVSIQKSFVDTMRHRRRHLQRPYTIPVLLHRNDIVNKNFNLRKLTKVLMKDMFLPDKGNFVMKFFVNERYAHRKHISDQAEESFRILLNQISDRPAGINTTEFVYNRSNELGLYLRTKVDDHVGSITPSDHDEMTNSIERGLQQGYRLVNEQKQFYAKFSSTNCSLSTVLPRAETIFSANWDLIGTDNSVAVNFSNLELADKISYIGIHPEHPQFLQLVYKKARNPVTGSEIQIIKIEDEAVIPASDSGLAIGIMPNYILTHRKFCKQNGLEFHEQTTYDFHSQPYLVKQKRNAGLFGVDQPADLVVPIILSPKAIQNTETGEAFEITKFSIAGYINLMEELKAPIIETLLTVSNKQGLLGVRTSPDVRVIPSENAWISVMLLKALGLENQYRVAEVPQIVDFADRVVSKLRPDFNEIYNKVPIDQVTEQFANEKHLFDESQFPISSEGTISVDAIRGLLLSTAEKHGEASVFDEGHKTSELLKLSILWGLYNNYVIKFLKAKDVRQVMIDIGFKNVFLDDPRQNVKDWNYFIAHKMLTEMPKFFAAKGRGDLLTMQKILEEFIVLINNGYWDLLVSEVTLAAKRPSELPRAKLYLKHLMGTIVYYLHLMSESFYPNEAMVVLKKLPLLRRDYDVNVDFERYKDNQEVYDKNAGKMNHLNDKMKNYLKMYDSDVLNNGSMLIELCQKLKEVVVSKHNSEDRFAVFFEVSDTLKFIKVKEFADNLNTVYSVFKNDKVFSNSTIKIVTELNQKYIKRDQRTATENGLESYAVPNSTGVFVHLVKVEDAQAEPEAVWKPWEKVGVAESEDELRFQDVMISDDAHRLITSDNSAFDKVFEGIMDIENGKREEREKAAETVAETVAESGPESEVQPEAQTLTKDN